MHVRLVHLHTRVDASLMATKDDVLQALKDKSKDTVLLDVRDQDEWIGTSSSPYGGSPNWLQLGHAACVLTTCS